MLFISRLFFIIFLSFNVTYADEIFNWHSSNIQLLRGSNYQLGAEDRSIMTFEYANGGSYGDFFMFVDTINPDDGNSTYYAEFSPRISLQNFTGRKINLGPFQDLSLAFTVEKPKNSQETYLYGIGSQLNIPGFSFFNANTYIRDNPDLSGNTLQLTLAWKRLFKIGSTQWVFEGFGDFSGSESGKSANQLIAPRLLMDLNSLWQGVAKKKLWLGIEYSYWNNKFGVSGVTEKVTQLQLKWVF